MKEENRILIEDLNEKTTTLENLTEEMEVIKIHN